RATSRLARHGPKGLRPLAAGNAPGLRMKCVAPRRGAGIIGHSFRRPIRGAFALARDPGALPHCHLVGEVASCIAGWRRSAPMLFVPKAILGVPSSEFRIP